MHSSEAGITETANSWSRTLGMTLRPWSGYSPLSLILRGAVQIAISIFFLVFAVRLLSPDEDNAQALRYLSGTAAIVLVSAAIVALLGAVRIVIGVLDLLTSRTVVGTVMSMSDRRFLDFLPEQLEHVIFARGQGIDRRRVRTEVVLSTASGQRQWTVRKRALRTSLRPGTTVRLTVTPLAGYVSSVETLPPHPGL